MAADDYEQCLELLTQGIALNKINPALNKDMQRVIDRTKDLIENLAQNNSATNNASQPDLARKTDNPKISKRVFLSAYQNQDDDTTH